MRVPTLLFLATTYVSAHDEKIPSVHDPIVSLDHVDHCATLGYDIHALDCRLCDELATYLTSTTLQYSVKKKRVTSVTQECHECCSNFSKVLEAEGRRYVKAVLAVSQYRLRRYPKVANFVEHHAPQMKRVEVKETNYRLPTLQFYDKEGEKMEEMSVAYWDEKSIGEFIENKLLPEETEEEDKDVMKNDDKVQVKTEL
ncbi:unnamed protein product [Peronospora belbahrii]|uniref:Selenoprotein F n=1 Tax=Peronospora belbahrii TaxID=622444 RepID=A0AAU9L5J7_9STRA|nr:unnamed protein product [Peronospora belbahrii]CAH0513246.1 unnamed protein product [Peronospora belbahrii]